MKSITPVALTIAGSDNSGGAGIEADLKSFTSLGVYGTCAITCVVAEHPGRVHSIQPVKKEILRDQIELVFEAFPVTALKTGMLFSTDLIRITVAAILARRKKTTVVVDPVMVATSGARLLKPAAVQYLMEELLPLAALVTPNLDEAEILFGDKITSIPAMREAAHAIQKKFGCAVLLKGGHLQGDTATDILATGDDIRVFESPYIRGIHTHGTGCTLSAAITARLALGDNLYDAVAAAKKFVTRAISRSIKLGKFSVLNHLP